MVYVKPELNYLKFIGKSSEKRTIWGCWDWRTRAVWRCGKKTEKSWNHLWYCLSPRLHPSRTDIAFQIREVLQTFKFLLLGGRNKAVRKAGDRFFWTDPWLLNTHVHTCAHGVDHITPWTHWDNDSSSFLVGFFGGGTTQPDIFKSSFYVCIDIYSTA